MTIPLPEWPLDEHGLLRRTAALAAAISDDQLAAAVKRKELARLTRGVFVPVRPSSDVATAAGRWRRYRLTCIASATSARAGKAPLSHQSAAMHGLPLLKPDLALVHVIRGGRGGGSIRGGRHRHAGVVPDDEIVAVDGVGVTSLCRTALDVAEAGTFAQALVVVDAALSRGVTRSSLLAGLAGRTTAGVRVARRAVEHGNGLSQSVGESWSRAQMIEAGLPLPVLQRGYTLAGFEQRPDFDWDGVLIGEFDGLIKYHGLLRPDEHPHDAVVREKLREDRFRQAGIHVVRWTWADLEQNKLIPLLRSSLARLGLLVPPASAH